MTLYTDGDFLSPHTDGNSGTYAFVAYLGRCHYRPSQGGRLLFWGGEVALEPGSNDLVLFRTRAPPGPLHEVEASGGGSYMRYGFTGWYNDVSDVMSEEELRERDKMRGSSIAFLFIE